MENNILSIAPEMVELSLNETEEISGGDWRERAVALILAVISAEWNDIASGFSQGYQAARQ